MDMAGKTALDYAREYGYSDITQLLIEAGISREKIL